MNDINISITSIIKDLQICFVEKIDDNISIEVIPARIETEKAKKICRTMPEVNAIAQKKRGRFQKELILIADDLNKDEDTLKR